MITFYKLMKDYGFLMLIVYIKNRLNYTLRKSFLKQQHIKRNIHNFKMFLDANDSGLSRALMFFGMREKDHFYVLNEILTKGDVVLDLGANIGYYVLIEANLIGDNGYIYAIEPVPSNVELLRKNISLNNIEDMVEVFQMGGSNKTSIEKLYLSDKSNLGTFFPTNYLPSSNLTNKTSPSLDIQTTTITDFIKGKRSIDLIRMDIEGYEVEVFEGMLLALDNKNFRPQILFETHRPKYNDSDHSMRKALEDMFERGYYTKIVVSNEHPKGGFINKGYKPEKLIYTDGYWRGIYYGITNEDALGFVCDIGFVRAVLLERK